MLGGGDLGEVGGEVGEEGVVTPGRHFWVFGGWVGVSRREVMFVSLVSS